MTDLLEHARARTREFQQRLSDDGVQVALGGRIGDSVVVTDSGYEFLTDYPRRLLVV